MIEDTAAGATDGSAVQDVPRKAKLTLDQKRQLVMMWFTQEEQGRIKDLPAGPGKNFVCRAARDLKLFQLRKLRASSSTEEVQRTSIDDMARRRVMSYHPRKFAAATTVTSPSASLSNWIAWMDVAPSSGMLLMLSTCIPTARPVEAKRPAAAMEETTIGPPRTLLISPMPNLASLDGLWMKAAIGAISIDSFASVDVPPGSLLLTCVLCAVCF